MAVERLKTVSYLPVAGQSYPNERRIWTWKIRCVLIIGFGALPVYLLYFIGYFYGVPVLQQRYSNNLVDLRENTSTAYLTIRCTNGRFGNQMSLLATLIGVAKLNGRRAAIKPCLLKNLQQHFDLSILPIVNTSDEFLVGHALKTYLNSKDEHIPKNVNVLVGEPYPFSYTFFQNAVPEIRRLLTFRPEYTDYAQKVLRQIASHYNEEVAACIFVGVHVRMTDYTWAVKQREGRSIDAEFFRKGMDHFRRKFTNETRRLIFVVASDDRGWCHKTFREFHDVFVSPPVKDPGFDMSLLAACNHSLISYGTFSFWTALLKYSGETVRFGDFYKPGSKFLTRFPFEKEYPPSWIIISTTPLDYWKNFKT